MVMIRDSDDPHDERNWIGQHRLLEGFFESLDHMAPVSLASLRRALLRAVANGQRLRPSRYVALDSVATMYFSPVPFPYIDRKHSPETPVALDVRSDGQLVVSLMTWTMNERMTKRRIERMLMPVLTAHRATLIEAIPADDIGPWAGNPWLWGLQIAPSVRGLTVGDAHRLGESIHDVLRVHESGPASAETLWPAILDGTIEVVLGRSESRFLEVKSQGFELDNLRSKIELSQAVARFANGDDSALLIVGLQERRRGNELVIERAAPQRFNSRHVDSYFKTIDARVFPPIENLEIEVVDDGTRGQLLCVLVPNQPPHLKPFLVHGAIVDGKAESAFISIVRRRGEHSIPIRPEEIHGALAAGRALLSGAAVSKSRSRKQA